MKQKKPVKPKYYNLFQLNMLLKDTCYEETVTFDLKMGKEYAFNSNKPKELQPSFKMEPQCTQ